MLRCKMTMMIRIRMLLQHSIKNTTTLQSKRSRSLKNSVRSQTSMKFWLTHWRQVSGKTRMWRKVFYVNCLVVAQKSSLRVERDDSEERLMYYFVEIHLQQNHNCFNTFTRLLQEESILQEREVRLLDLQFTSQRTLRLRNLYSRVEHLFFQIRVSVALMSLTKWMTIQGPFSMRQWSSRQSLLPRQVSSVPWMLEPLFWLLQTPWIPSTTHQNLSLITSDYHQL